MDDATNGAGSRPEVPILGQIYQRLNTMDGKLVIIISLDQETVAPNTDPVANAHLATLSTASGSTVVAQGSSLTLHSRPASAATRPGTHIRSPALSAGSNSAGGSRVASPTANMRPSSAVARPASTAHLAAHAAASSTAGVARSASPAMGMRPSAAATPVAVGNVVLQLLPTHLVLLPLLRKLLQLHT
ncbi:hypothetical protein GGI08_000243 [Coemansia sp. S2]|nr:hypothetical protein GGI08_000243 [Coemansia sp. S2]KAJ2075880.1 hypothetical protein GGH13_000303 [Coemansia sp. S155-1]